MSILCPTAPLDLLPSCPTPLHVLFDSLSGSHRKLVPPARHFVSFDVYKNKAPLCIVVAVKDCGVFYGGDEGAGNGGMSRMVVDLPHFEDDQQTRDFEAKGPLELADLSRMSLETVRLDSYPVDKHIERNTTGRSQSRKSRNSTVDTEESSLLTLGEATDGRQGAWIRGSMEESLKEASGGGIDGENVVGSKDEDLLRSESTLAFRKGQRMAVVETVGGWYIGWLLANSTSSTSPDSSDHPSDTPDFDLSRLRFSLSHDHVDHVDHDSWEQDHGDVISHRRVGLIPSDRVVVCKDWLRRRFVGSQY
ncbi:hypothetical protein HDU93_006869 [Gonapodya sp. JEL0774]|nr:hypothetical protein HDU93_006869 [Gonapodya sp. JEL0774]